MVISSIESFESQPELEDHGLLDLVAFKVNTGKVYRRDM